MSNGSLASARPSAARLLHDVRAVADVADFDLAKPVSASSELWVVMRTDPGPTSGSATVSGTWIDAATGVITSAQTSTEPVASVTRDGEWHILSVLSGASDMKTGRYEWTEPRVQRTRGPTRDDLYDPFAHPAHVVCRFDPERSAAPFTEVTVLPAKWESHVRQAVVEARATGAPGGGTGSGSQAELERARSLVNSSNPLLSTRGMAVLARHGALTDDLYEELLGSVHDYPRAVLHYVAIRHPHGDGVARRRSMVERDLAGDTDARRAAALGIATATVFGPRVSSGGAGPAPPVTHAELLRAAPPDDDYVSEAMALVTAPG